MFGITSISFNGYFLGICGAYIIGLFVTFFTHGNYSMAMLFTDVFGGAFCILLTDLVGTFAWNLRKFLNGEED